MSIRIMSAIFESTRLAPTERLIMLALADHADDDGRCYPSIARLCQRTGLKERAIQGNIKKLAEQGYLTLIAGGGRGNANLFIIHTNPASAAGNAGDKPRTRNTVSDDKTPHLTTETPHLTTLNPAADAPEPSGTIKEKEEEGRELEISGLPDPSLTSRIADALGFNDASGTGWPKYWMMADAALTVSRWITDFGLTPDEVVHVATSNARAHGSPANGPKTLTRHMHAYASAKSAPPLQPIAAQGTRHDRATASDRREAAAADRLRSRLYAAARVD